MPKSKIEIFDTTLRDGSQAPGCGLLISEKLELAKKLFDLNVDVIEAGFPISSNAELESVIGISEYFKNKGPIICAFSRVSKIDIDRCWLSVEKANRRRIHLGIGSSDIHIKSKLNLSHLDVLNKTRELVKYASNFNWQIQFYAEDATRANYDFLKKLINIAEESGASIINLPDTTGISSSDQYFKLIEYISNNLKNKKSKISTHCHDDMGLACANSLAGIKAGARQIECTVGGIGERCGNAALEEILANLDNNQDFKFLFEHNLKNSEIFNLANLVYEAISKDLPINKAIIGLNAFSTEAGIHADGNYKNSNNYLSIDPIKYGRKEETILGARSGKATLKNKLLELGINQNSEDLEKFYNYFIKKADLLLKKRGIKNETLSNIYKEYEKIK